MAGLQPLSSFGNLPHAQRGVALESGGTAFTAFPNQATNSALPTSFVPTFETSPTYPTHHNTVSFTGFI